MLLEAYSIASRSFNTMCECTKCAKSHTCSESDLLHLRRRLEGVEFPGTEAPDLDTRTAEGSGQETGVI